MDVSLVPIYSYAKKGIFADLYPLLDENEGRENYVSSVVSLAESEGKLYTIPVRFALWGMLIRNDYYETHPSVTLDDLLELSAEELFLSEPLRTLVEANLTLFSSDNALQELEKILILSKTAQEASVVSQSPVVQMPYGWYQVSQYCDAQRILDDYAPAGWPELGTDGLAAYPLVELAINADAGCAQGAWAALSYMLSLEGQEAMQDYGLPVSIPALDIQFQSAQADGMSQEQADQFRNMIAGAGAIVRQDSTILTICQEEIQALYAEDKTAHECAEVIMNRVNIYLEEQTTD